MTHPLEALFRLVDEGFHPKPTLQDASHHYEAPAQDLSVHPEFKRKSKMNTAVKVAGMTPTSAHSLINGPVDLGNVESKAALASDLGRFQNDSSKNEVRPEEGSNSIFAQDVEKEMASPDPTKRELKTPKDMEVAEGVDMVDEICYDDEDAAYILKYGNQ